jgi:hypothetical protein
VYSIRTGRQQLEDYARTKDIDIDRRMSMIDIMTLISEENEFIPEDIYLRNKRDIRKRIELNNDYTEMQQLSERIAPLWAKHIEELKIRRAGTIDLN